MKREVVVTGIGAVTPLGVGARTLYERWRAGVSGIEDGAGRCSEFDPAETPGIITPYMFLYALHDAVLKPMPSGPQTPCLARRTPAKRGRTVGMIRQS